jgi:cytochrome P450
LPERFDPESPLYLTPDGKKRSPFSWTPFNGGKRICFGKTFAESNLKFIATYLSQFFDFEFVEHEKYATKFPLAFFFMSKTVPVDIRLREREE